MSLWLSIITGILKLIGMADTAAQLARDSQQRDIGRKLQSADESNETIKTSQDMAEASTNAPQGGEELAERLRKGDA